MDTRIIIPSREILNLLGKIPDLHIVQRTGMNRDTIRRIRRRLGIPVCRYGAVRKYKGISIRASSRNIKVSRNKEMFRMREAGQTLQMIATRFGVSRQRIHGILKRGY